MQSTHQVVTQSLIFNTEKHDEDLKNQLEKYGISSEQYEQDKFELDILGYSIDQIHTLLFQESSADKVAAIIAFHHDLVDFLGLSRVELIRIISCPGSKINILQAIMVNKTILKEWDFTPNDILEIVFYVSVNTLDIMIENQLILKELGLKPKDIIKIVSERAWHGGIKKLTAVIEKNKTKKIGISPSHHEEKQAEDKNSLADASVVKKNDRSLENISVPSHAINFSVKNDDMPVVQLNQEIKKIPAVMPTSSDNTAKKKTVPKKSSIRKVKEKPQKIPIDLPRRSTRKKEKLNNHFNGELKNNKNIKNKKQLESLGYNIHQINKLFLQKAHQEKIDAVLELHSWLIQYFTHDQIITMVTNKCSSENLEAVKENYNHLKELGYDEIQIVRIVSRPGGPNKLDAIKRYHGKLKDLGFDSEQIIRAVSYGGGSGILDSIVRNYNALKEFGFDNGCIIRMVSWNGGSKNLDSIVKNYSVLESLRFNREQMVNIVRRSGGTKNIKMIVDQADLVKKMKTDPKKFILLAWNAPMRREFHAWLTHKLSKQKRAALLASEKQMDVFLDALNTNMNNVVMEDDYPVPVAQSSIPDEKKGSIDDSSEMSLSSLYELVDEWLQNLPDESFTGSRKSVNDVDNASQPAQVTVSVTKTSGTFFDPKEKRMLNEQQLSQPGFAQATVGYHNLAGKRKGID